MCTRMTVKHGNGQVIELYFRHFLCCVVHCTVKFCMWWANLKFSMKQLELDGSYFLPQNSASEACNEKSEHFIGYTIFYTVFLWMMHIVNGKDINVEAVKQNSHILSNGVLFFFFFFFFLNYAMAISWDQIWNFFWYLLCM